VVDHVGIAVEMASRSSSCLTRRHVPLVAGSAESFKRRSSDGGSLLIGSYERIGVDPVMDAFLFFVVNLVVASRIG